DHTLLRARVHMTYSHTNISFCELAESSQLPLDFSRAIDRYNTRSGTVKVNLALGELPRFEGLAPEDSATAARSFIQLCDSMEYLEHAFDDAKYGKPSAAPYSDGVIPTVVDDSLAPRGKHLMSCFTQYVPASWSQAPHRDELEAYAD